MRASNLAVVGLVTGFSVLPAWSCQSERTAPLQPAPLVEIARETVQPQGPVVVDSAASPQASARASGVQSEPNGAFADWLSARIPPAGKVMPTDAGAVKVIHTVAPDDTPSTIAKAYLDITDVYRAKDLAAEIAKRAPNIATGALVEIPHVLTAPYKTPEEDRLRWPASPAERALKGVFISGIFAGSFWPETIERLAARGLNAAVLDAKDYMGTVNYPTHVKLALETGAAKDPPIPDYSRAIRFAHARGVRIIARIPCFHDPWAAKRAPRLSVMSVGGRPFEMGWTDPANAEAQDYIVDLVKEVVDLGADEVQLDYVRFPVYSPGIKYAALPPADGHRSQAIKAFVRRVHDATHARMVPLSLDLFGVTATGSTEDIEGLGQNIGVIGAEAEALSPMVYPSHYAPGFNGFQDPGNHPEIIGIGTKAAIDKLKGAHNTSTIMRPWLQASNYKASAFGPKYIQEEIRSAEAGGAIGWLMWDPDNNYWAVWRALPVIEQRAADAGPPSP
ncbi:MAG: hypothetical protein M3O46_23055 [Myxococcota bacterium]|nr:hypothetical protein [Myxococcota bacterium]